MERFNFDIIIFLSMIFLCYFRSNVFNLLLILFLTLAKFYPILFSPIFFFNKKIKKIFVNYIYFLIFIILTFIILYLDRNNLFKIFNNIEEFQAVYAWSFNFFALSKIPDVKVLLSNQLLISFSFFLFFIFFLLGFYLSKKTRLERDFILTNNLYYKELLFLISSGLLVSVYFIFNNVMYREIFLFGLIPLLLTLNKKNSFFRILINFIIFHLIYSSFSFYFAVYKKNNFFLIFDKIFDICFMSLLAGIIFFLYSHLLMRLINLHMLFTDNKNQ